MLEMEKINHSCRCEGMSQHLLVPSDETPTLMKVIAWNFHKILATMNYKLINIIKISKKKKNL